MSKPTLETPRLILREWQDSDIAPFAALLADPTAMESIPLPDRFDVTTMVTSLRDHFARPDGLGWWVIEERNGASFIGFTGLSLTHLEVPFAPAVDIGWCLSPTHWGNGYAYEAAKAVTAYGFDALNLAEIVGFTIKTNQRARALMERLGMIRVPADDFDDPRLTDGDPFKRNVLYRLKNKALG